jgi:hypothetical protein
MTTGEAILEHWPLLTGVGAAAVVVGGIIAKAIRAREKEDERIKRVAAQVVVQLIASDAFAVAVEKVIAAGQARVEERLRELKERDDQQATSIRSAHERIDRLNDDVKQIWATVAGGVK